MTDGHSPAVQVTMNVTVTDTNVLPVLVLNQDLTVKIDQTTGIMPINLTAYDEEGDIVTFEVVAPPSYGKISLTSFSQTDVNDGNLTYKPNPGYAGTDVIMFKMSDTIGSSNTLVTLKILVQ
jgi:hypothetical protein